MKKILIVILALISSAIFAGKDYDYDRWNALYDKCFQRIEMSVIDDGEIFDFDKEAQFLRIAPTSLQYFMYDDETPIGLLAMLFYDNDQRVVGERLFLVENNDDLSTLIRGMVYYREPPNRMAYYDIMSMFRVTGNEGKFYIEYDLRLSNVELLHYVFTMKEVDEIFCH